MGRGESKKLNAWATSKYSKLYKHPVSPKGVLQVFWLVQSQQNDHQKFWLVQS